MKSLKEFLDSCNIDANDVVEAEDLPRILGEAAKNDKMDPPMVLIMRRKTVRQFPNGQRVALYYVDKINKYVTVPYSAMQWSASVEEELNSHDKLKMVIENNNVGSEVSNDIFKIYNRLNEANKQKFLEMAEQNFNNLLSFVKKNK